MHGIMNNAAYALYSRFIESDLMKIYILGGHIP